MIESPLGIFLLGLVAGGVFVLLSVLPLVGRDLSHLEGRVRRLRSGLEVIARLDAGPAAASARGILDTDAKDRP